MRLSIIFKSQWLVWVLQYVQKQVLSSSVIIDLNHHMILKKKKQIYTNIPYRTYFS